MKKKPSTSPKKPYKKAKAKPKIVALLNEVVSDVPESEIFGTIEQIPLNPVQLIAEVIPEAPKKIKPKDKVHYVNSKEFEDEIRNYYNTGVVTIKLGESLNKIANGLSYAPNFLNYSYKEDMIGDAIVKMFSALKNKKFKLDSGFSPFSYFTTIAFHAFINRIKKEKKHHEVINEYREKVYTELMIEASDSCAGSIYVEPTGDDESNDE
jgi:hypothetical protein